MTIKLLKFLVNFTLLKYFKSQRSYGFLITKELIFGFQVLGLKDHFSASLTAVIKVVSSVIRNNSKTNIIFLIHIECIKIVKAWSPYSCKGRFIRSTFSLIKLSN